MLPTKWVRRQKVVKSDNSASQAEWIGEVTHTHTHKYSLLKMKGNNRVCHNCLLILTMKIVHFEGPPANPKAKLIQEAKIRNVRPTLTSHTFFKKG